MRFAFLSILFCLFLSTQAQQDSSLAKKWLVGGNAEIYFERIDQTPARLIAIISPQAGFFLTKNWAVGLRIPLSFKSNEYQIAIRPFVRYYFSIKGNIKPFLELNTGFEWHNILDPSTLEPNYKEKSLLFGAQGGAAFFIKSNISVDIFLYYDGKSRSWDNKSLGQTGTNLLEEFGLGVGFQIYL